MSFIPVLQYIVGLGVFGFLYWLLDGIARTLDDVSETGDVYNILFFFWAALVILYQSKLAGHILNMTNLEFINHDAIWIYAD